MRFPLRLAQLGLIILLSACSTVTPPPHEAISGVSTPAVPEKLLTTVDPSALSTDERYSVGGLPIATRSAVILRNIGYAVGFSEELIDPLWAAYYCGPVPTFDNGPRLSKFKPDARVRPDARLVHEDYNRPPGNPTYDRGHMAPNYAIATRYGREAQVESFLMTNVVPQRSSLNQDTWMALEAEIARNFALVCKGVWVAVGPIFKGSVSRYNGKAAMPSGFFCIVVDRTDAGQLRPLALTMDQSVTGKRRLGDFITTIRDIEAQTGINFFAGLPDDIEAVLENAKADSDWNWELILDKGKYAGAN